MEQSIRESVIFEGENPFFWGWYGWETPTLSCARVLLDIQVETLLYSHLKKGLLDNHNPIAFLFFSGIWNTLKLRKSTPTSSI